MKKICLFALTALFLFSACGGNNKNSDAYQTDTESEDFMMEDSLLSADLQTGSVIEALRSRYKEDIEAGLLNDASREFRYAAFDLNEDEKDEYLISLTGPYFCGSGGCTLLLLSSDFLPITEFSVSDIPVLVSKTSTKGWSDLFVSSNGEYHRICFDGKEYPSNPSVGPVEEEAVSLSKATLLDPENESLPWLDF